MNEMLLSLRARLRTSRSSTRVLRVGLDLVDVDEVAASLSSPLADRYLSRVYTPAEVRDCTVRGRGVVPARLAARFAAKEAAMKALGVGDRAVPWLAIEVVRCADGQPTLALRGAAAALARAAGLSQFALSLSHEKDYASAMVVASA
jgi:holo-[acyl-carrier protein] synthase